MAKIIEIAGTPDSGKTTALRNVSEELRKRGISTEVIIETRGKNLFPHEQRGTLEYNIKVGTITCRNIIERVKDSMADIILIDKGYVDYLFWIDYYLFNKKCSVEEAENARKLQQFQDERLIPDLFIGMTVEPEVAIARCEDKPETRTVKLKEHNEVFYRFFDSYTLTEKYLIDTTELSKEEVCQEIIKKIFNS